MAGQHAESWRQQARVGHQTNFPHKGHPLGHHQPFVMPPPNYGKGPANGGPTSQWNKGLGKGQSQQALSNDYNNAVGLSNKGIIVSPKGSVSFGRSALASSAVSPWLGFATNHFEADIAYSYVRVKLHRCDRVSSTRTSIFHAICLNQVRNVTLF